MPNDAATRLPASEVGLPASATDCQRSRR